MSASADNDVLVEIDGLTRVFDLSKPWLNRVIEREPKRTLTAIDNVSFEIRKGETFALVGESGSGKSTIAKLIVNLLAPSSGRVLFDGDDMRKATAAKARQMRSRLQHRTKQS